MNRETRPIERLQEHYEVERELAGRLRASSPAERATLYTALYGELFDRVHDHPQNWADPAKREQNTTGQVRFLDSFLKTDTVFVELGCGDAAVSKALAPRIRKAIGVDVTPALMDRVPAPPNFQFLQTAGVELALPDRSADIAYSNQLMEHLHTEDALAQLREVHRILRPGGLYLCSTPSRVTGPHDISGYFGYEATGFHLREYDYAGLGAMFKRAGFSSVRAHLTLKGRTAMLPIWCAAWAEAVVLRLPPAFRVRVGQLRLVRSLAGLMVVGRA